MNFFPSQVIPSKCALPCDSPSPSIKEGSTNSFPSLFQQVCSSKEGSHSPEIGKEKLVPNHKGRGEGEDKKTAVFYISEANINVAALSLLSLFNPFILDNKGSAEHGKGNPVSGAKGLSYEEKRKIYQFLQVVLKKINKGEGKKIVLKFKDDRTRRRFLDQLKGGLKKVKGEVNKKAVTELISSLKKLDSVGSEEINLPFKGEYEKTLKNALLHLQKEFSQGPDIEKLQKSESKGGIISNTRMHSNSRTALKEKEIPFSHLSTSSEGKDIKSPFTPLFEEKKEIKQENLGKDRYSSDSFLERKGKDARGEWFHRGKLIGVKREKFSLHEIVRDKVASGREKISKSQGHRKNLTIHLHEPTGQLGNKGDNLHSVDATVKREEILRQIENGVMRHLPGGKRELELQLHPPELGRVKINISVNNKEVSLVVKVEHSEVAKSLNQHITNFENSFEKQGLKLVKVEIKYGFGDRGEPSWMGFNQGQGEDGRRNARETRRAKISPHLTLVGEREIETLDVEGIKNPLSAIYLIA